MIIKLPEIHERNHQDFEQRRQNKSAFTQRIGRRLPDNFLPYTVQQIPKHMKIEVTNIFRKSTPSRRPEIAKSMKTNSFLKPLTGEEFMNIINKFKEKVSADQSKVRKLNKDPSVVAENISDENSETPVPETKTDDQKDNQQEDTEVVER